MNEEEDRTMNKLSKLLLAAALTGAAILSMPPKASATDFCASCAQTGECFPCCRCDGTGPAQCFSLCR
jgi:hypothetical protein